MTNAERIARGELMVLERLFSTLPQPVPSRCCALPLRYRGPALGWCCTGCGQPQ